MRVRRAPFARVWLAGRPVVEATHRHLFIDGAKAEKTVLPEHDAPDCGNDMRVRDLSWSVTLK